MMDVLRREIGTHVTAQGRARAVYLRPVYPTIQVSPRPFFALNYQSGARSSSVDNIAYLHS